MTLREYVRRWLGYDDLPTRGNIAAIEKADRDRHSEILTMLNQINQQLQVQHIGKNKAVKHPPSWEAIEAEALSKIEAEQAKEPNR